MTIARVELDVPIAGPFDYECGPVDVCVGALVAVSFGRRRLVGVVTGLADRTAIDKSRLKRIERALPVEPLPASTLSLAAFCADYYRHPVGQVLSAAIPTMLRKPDYGKRVRAWEYCLSGSGIIDLEASINPRATGPAARTVTSRMGINGITISLAKSFSRLTRPMTITLWGNTLDAGWCISGCCACTTGVSSLQNRARRCMYYHELLIHTHNVVGAVMPVTY